MEFTAIDTENWERREHYRYYKMLIKCRYTLFKKLEVTELTKECKIRGIKFFPAFLYAVSYCINQNKEFRMALDENGNPGYWKEVCPSYTIFHEDDKTFSDIWTDYNEDFSVFYKNVLKDMEDYKNVKGIKAKPEPPAWRYPISCVPWLSFDGYSIDTCSDSSMMLPIITFGRYTEENGVMKLPFSLFAHHGAADGYHSCKLINEIACIVKNTRDWLK